VTGSDYEPLFSARRSPVDDLEAVRALFAAAAAPFTRSPWSWVGWALLLPAAALSTGRILGAFGPSVVVLVWCSVILIGGLLEMWVIRRGGGVERTTLAGWVLRSQANLSFVAVAISIVLVWHDRLDLLPGLWLLILGHSFLVLGGLAFKPFRRAGWIYQLAGLAALVPGQEGLVWFAAAAALGNLSIALSVGRPVGR
jgi:hypothetical protein